MEVTEVAFEGAFISVHGHAAGGKRLSAEVEERWRDGGAGGRRKGLRQFRCRPRAAPPRCERAELGDGRPHPTLRKPGLTAIFCLLVAFWLLVLVILPNFSMLFESFYPYLPVVELCEVEGCLHAAELRKDPVQPDRDQLVRHSDHHPDPRQHLRRHGVLFGPRHADDADPGLSAGLFPGQGGKPQVDPDAASPPFHPDVGVRGAAGLRLVHHPDLQRPAECASEGPWDHRPGGALAERGLPPLTMPS